MARYTLTTTPPGGQTNTAGRRVRPETRSVIFIRERRLGTITPWREPATSLGLCRDLLCDCHGYVDQRWALPSFARVRRDCLGAMKKGRST